MGCVYVAANLTNGKLYIGKTMGTLAERKRHHRTSAKCGRTTRFCAAIRKYGIDGFSWEPVFVSCDNTILSVVECFYILMLMTNEVGYNLTIGGEGATGMKHTSESREKMRAYRLGRKRSAEERAAVSAGMRGRPVSKETRCKIAESNRGQRRSCETRKNISHAQSKRPPMSIATKAKVVTALIGRKVSQGTRDKIATALKGRKRPLEFCEHMSRIQKGKKRKPRSAETKAKLSAIFKGRPISEEQKQLLSKLNTGKKQSPETRARRAASMRATWARRKAASLQSS